MTAVVLAVLDISEALSRNAASFDYLIVGFLYNFRLKQFQTHVIQQRQIDKLAWIPTREIWLTKFPK
jgi:hypothetical protein